MKKYWFIFKSELMSNLSYLLNILGHFIGFFIHILIFFYIWRYIYSDPNEIIHGYSFIQTVWYVVITEIVWSVVGGRFLVRKISEDVRGGNRAYNINKPYNYILYSVSSYLGEVFIKSVAYFGLGLLVGFIFLKGFPDINFIQFIAFLVTGYLAVIINTLLTIFIGLFSFIIEDSIPFYWLYSKIMLIIGVVFPIEFFPKVIQPIAKLSPIFAVCYGPAKLFVAFSWKLFLVVLLAQIAYIILAYIICSLLYRKGVRNLNVNGV